MFELDDYQTLRSEEDDSADPLDDPEVHRFLACYRSLDFGWKLAYTLARAELPFPTEMYGKHAYIFEAYCHLSGIEKSDTIRRVIALRHESQTHSADIIKALLLAQDSSYDAIADALGVPEAVVTAYEHLFFNVYGRKHDALLLAQIVYPSGRLEETSPEYHKVTGANTLLMRAGYLYGMADVLSMAGIRRDLGGALPAIDAASKLETLFMTQGYFWARNGFASVRAVEGGPVASARGLITAAKQSGSAAPTMDDDDMAGVGEILRDELMVRKRDEYQRAVKAALSAQGRNPALTDAGATP